ncbi:4-hydroxy-tetrahydrodipicolinate synthase [Georgenia yuyongxinii]|uniref:4-hydroxy-tetrahydrodipicolinate synthase n=1 Tax=Georgenia yuyongxinii TaxID=2589797 RepID=A0A5B8C1R6_9MICO|nr:4-hydroxy-tetrahydrodipicolinate synthase [Georgenia yuyongxinii]QDC24288.1 4-hydroxy-tetrahydrodipicolinate synthase [Georgenia yuyongxinii]
MTQQPASASHPSRTFGSVSTAMVTPFHADGSIDIDSAVRVAVKLVDDGCDALVLNGTTGESPTTHQPEKDDLVRAVVDAVGARAMIIGGAGSNDTAHAVRIAQGAERSGARGVLVVSPYYNRPSQEGVYRHIKAVADAVDLPVLLYDIPGRTGVAIGDETLDRLAEHPRVLGVKDATGDVPAGFERMARTGLEFYSGDDGLNFDWLAHGASGVVSVVGHVAAGAYAEMVRAVDAGDLPGARAVAARMRPLVAAIMGGGQGAVMAKHALHLQGVLPSTTVRLPLVEATPAEVAALEQVLREHTLIPA